MQISLQSFKVGKQIKLEYKIYLESKILSEMFLKEHDARRKFEPCYVSSDA